MTERRRQSTESHGEESDIDTDTESDPFQFKPGHSKVQTATSRKREVMEDVPGLESSSGDEEEEESNDGGCVPVSSAVVASPASDRRLIMLEEEHEVTNLGNVGIGSSELKDTLIMEPIGCWEGKVTRNLTIIAAASVWMLFLAMVVAQHKSQ